MLLVDGDEAEAPEHRSLLHQCMRSDDEHGLAAGEFFRRRFPFARTETTSDEDRINSEWRQQPDERSGVLRSEEHTSELQSHSDLVCRLLLEKKKKHNKQQQDITAVRE